MKHKMVPVAEGVYRLVKQDGRKGGYFERVLIDGMNTYKRLAASREREAVEARALNRAQYAQWKRGVPGVRNPYESFVRQDAEFFKIVESYKAAGCPRRGKQKERSESMQKQVKYALDSVCRWPGWDKQPIESIDGRVLTRYETWRRSKRMTNGRAIDLEISYLSGALRWAAFRGLITRNPLAGLERPSFQNGASTPCREARPENAEELHALARTLFLNEASEVLGWQYLFECFIGLRTSEVLRLRMDAKPGQPGFVDGNVLYVQRSKSGINPFVIIHPAFATLLAAHKAWHARRYPPVETENGETKPGSSWYFPSPKFPQLPVAKHSLAHALKRISEKRRTSHGARAYYVTARRSDFEPGKTVPPTDAQIAAEIGDVTGAPIIQRIYGDLPPNWLDSKAGKITFLPEGAPAWDVFSNLEQLKAYRDECIAEMIAKIQASKAEKMLLRR